MKKRFDRLLLCALTICALAVPAGLADGGDASGSVPETQPPVTQAPATPEPATPEPANDTPTQQPASDPTQEPGGDPTQEPGGDPTQEPGSDPTQEPGNDPTQEPGGDPTQEPTSDPTQEPGSDPTQEPGGDPTQEPTSDPTQEPTSDPTQEPGGEPTQDPTPNPSVSPEPGDTPRPLPGSIDGLVNITPEGTAQQENELWRIQLSAPDAQLAFAWTVDGEASAYLVYTQSGQDEPYFIAETTDARIDFSPENYEQGQHTLYVGAYLADGNITWGKLVFELASRQRPSGGGFPGGRFPGGFGGGFPGGSASRGQMSQEEQGFRVTPGKALTSKHSSGTMDTTAYNHSDISFSDEALTSLQLSSTQTEITLEGGAAFFAAAEDGKLQLVPESGSGCWNLSALAMKTLAESGIDTAVFYVGDNSSSISTRMEFSGSVYAALRAQGYVSKDMEIRIDTQGVRVYVAGGVYSINESGELVPCGE